MPQSQILIREVKTRRDLSKFIKLPYKIHKNHKQWLPPILSDEWKVFDPKKNPAFQHCDTILLMAEQKGKVVGRIMGIINHTYNEGKNEKNGRFSFLECYDDGKVFDSLLQKVERWAAEKGMEQLVGPLGFSDKDPQGFLIEGFDDPMTVMITNHNYPFMVSFMEENGYAKELDLVQYRINTIEKLPLVYNRIAERVLNKGYRVIEFKNTKTIRQYIEPILNLINESYKNIYGFAPLTDVEAKEFSNRFLPILNPDFVKLIFDKNEELAAFIIAMPDMSAGLRATGGKLFPFGFIRILRSMKKTKQLNLLLGSIKESRRNAGLDAVLAVKILESATSSGFTVLDTHLIMETNKKMRAECERLDAEMYKKYGRQHLNRQCNQIAF